jgi:nucleoside-triphosphatase THEP1
MYDFAERPILVVTGPKGGGKTSLALALADLAAAGLGRLSGIASPSQRDERGRVLAVEALDLGSRESRLLATRSSDLGGPRLGGRDEPGLSFSPSTLSWACRTFLQALQGPATFLILDEVGSLELDAGGGFWPLLEALGRREGLRERACLLTVRLGLAARLLDFLPPGRAELLELGRKDSLTIAAQAAAIAASWAGQPWATDRGPSSPGAGSSLGL